MNKQTSLYRFLGKKEWQISNVQMALLICQNEENIRQDETTFFGGGH